MNTITEIETEDDARGIQVIERIIEWINTGSKGLCNVLRTSSGSEKAYYIKRATEYIQAANTYRYTANYTNRNAAAYKMQVIEKEFIADWKKKKLGAK